MIGALQVMLWVLALVVFGFALEIALVTVLRLVSVYWEWPRS